MPEHRCAPLGLWATRQPESGMWRTPGDPARRLRDPEFGFLTPPQKCITDLGVPVGRGRFDGSVMGHPLEGTVRERRSMMLMPPSRVT